MCSVPRHASVNDLMLSISEALINKVHRQSSYCRRSNPRLVFPVRAARERKHWETLGTDI